MTKEQKEKNNRKEQEKKLRIYLAKIEKQIKRNENSENRRT
jgi:hypothetical protein